MSSKNIHLVYSGQSSLVPVVWQEIRIGPGSDGPLPHVDLLAEEVKPDAVVG